MERVATFSTLSIDKAGAGYTLGAASGVLSGATSAGFNITNAAAASIALFSGDAQTGTVTTSLGSPLVVLITDHFGNPVPGVAVTFSSGSTPAGATGQSVGTSSATTGLDGKASSTATLGTKAGGYTFQAASAGLTGSPVTFSATATPRPTITSLILTSGTNPSSYADSLTFTATVTGAGGNPNGEGTVSFYEVFSDSSSLICSGPISLTGNAAACTIGSLNAAGSPHTITAQYSGSSSGVAFAGSTSNALSQTVQPARLTIIANNTSKPYGAALPPLTVTYTGLVNGDSAASLTTPPTVTTTATASSHVAGNPYAVTAAGAFDADYIISYTAGTLTVTPAPLPIAANNQTKVYGAPLPTLTVTYTSLVNGDSAASLTTPPTVTTTATASSHVAGNPYSITASGAVDADYSISYLAGILTVTPAPLTITAANKTKVYGAGLPSLTVSYSGLVNGDSATSLTTPPTVTTTATSSSHVAGNPYSITASGAVDADYGISYVAGTLTVTPAALTITADNQTKVYGAPLPSLTVTYGGLVNGDNAGSLTTPPTVTTTATAGSHVAGNPYSITAAGAVDADYSVSYTTGTLAVTPAAAVIE